MPKLSQLTCNIEWASSKVPFKEYGISYGDGSVECYVPVPHTPTSFSIHLTSNGYISSGLAMFVFTDGVYQCNRNRNNLIPTGKLSRPAKAKGIDFRVRQKEERLPDGNWTGRPWRFEPLRIVGSMPIVPEINESHFENLGNIVVVVLRCEPCLSKSNTSSDGSLTPESAMALGPEVNDLESIGRNGNIAYQDMQNPRGAEETGFGETLGTFFDGANGNRYRNYHINEDSYRWYPRGRRQRHEYEPRGPHHVHWDEVPYSRRDIDQNSPRDTYNHRDSSPDSDRIRNGYRHWSASGSPYSISNEKQENIKERDYCSRCHEEERHNLRTRNREKITEYDIRDKHERAAPKELNPSQCASWENTTQNHRRCAPSIVLNVNSSSPSGIEPVHSNLHCHQCNRTPRNARGPPDTGCYMISNGERIERHCCVHNKCCNRNHSQTWDDKRTLEGDSQNDNRDQGVENQTNNPDENNWDQPNQYTNNDWEQPKSDTKDSNHAAGDTWDQSNGAQDQFQGNWDTEQNNNNGDNNFNPENNTQNQPTWGDPGPDNQNFDNTAQQPDWQAQDDAPAWDSGQNADSNNNNDDDNFPQWQSNNLENNTSQHPATSPNNAQANFQPFPSESQPQAEPLPSQASNWISSQPVNQNVPIFVTPMSRGQEMEEPPLYTVPEQIAQAESLSHQVQFGRSSNYVHKVRVPQYIDTMEEPYARFVFKYRIKEVIESKFGVSVERDAEAEKKILESLPREQMLNQLLHAHGLLGQQGYKHQPESNNHAVNQVDSQAQIPGWSGVNNNQAYGHPPAPSNPIPNVNNNPSRNEPITVPSKLTGYNNEQVNSSTNWTRTATSNAPHTTSPVPPPAPVPAATQLNQDPFAAATLNAKLQDVAGQQDNSGSRGGVQNGDNNNNDNNTNNNWNGGQDWNAGSGEPNSGW